MQITFCDVSNKYNGNVSPIYCSFNTSAAQSCIFVCTHGVCRIRAQQTFSFELIFTGLEKKQNPQIKETTVLLTSFNFKYLNSVFEVSMSCVSLSLFVITHVFLLQNFTPQASTAWQKSPNSSQTLTLLGL